MHDIPFMGGGVALAKRMVKRLAKNSKCLAKPKMFSHTLYPSCINSITVIDAQEGALGLIGTEV